MSRPLSPPGTHAVPFGQPAARAVFLHTGWRSGGTWLWARFRASPRTRGYYEPFSEQLARLRPGNLRHYDAAHWQSGHQLSTPYYAEFAPLLPRTGSGVRGFEDRFALRDFFPSPSDGDGAMAEYLHGLIRHAEDDGRIAVLKLCRGHGRAAWLHDLFPQAWHVLLLRDLRAQWDSIRRQADEHGNPYFLAAILGVLAHAQHHQLAAAASAHFALSLPALTGYSVALDMALCERHLQRLNPAERLSVFLAFWCATHLAAAPAADRLIDFERLSDDTAYRMAVEAEAAAAIGAPLSLAGAQAVPGLPPGAPGLSNTLLAKAAQFVRMHGAALPGATRDALLAKIAAGEEAPPAISPPPCPTMPRPADGAIARLAWRAQVMRVATTLPLRRAKAGLRRWRTGF